MSFILAFLALGTAKVIDDEYQPQKILANEVTAEGERVVPGPQGTYARRIEQVSLVSSKARTNGAIDTFLEIDLKHVFYSSLSEFQGFERANFKGGGAADFSTSRKVELCMDICGVNENLSVRLTSLPKGVDPISLRFYDAAGEWFDVTIDRSDLAEHLSQVRRL